MNPTQQYIYLILIAGAASLVIFTVGLVVGWNMGKRLLRSVMAAYDPDYNDAKKKDTSKMVSTHDDGKNYFTDAHIAESIPTRIDTLSEEKG